jgi:[NiFe] hydrogenase assembly HybE family chaperone
MTAETALLPDPSRRLEDAFRAKAAHMTGLGFVNPALQVEAVGFAPWEGHWLGVMVTPWSINLLLLPHDRSRWQSRRLGEAQRYSFPAGRYDFISANDPAFGEYRMCSLLSPALEIADHATARMVAELARAALFDAANSETHDDAAVDAVSDESAGPGPLAQLQQTAKAPMSKRDFLRGRVFRGEATDESRR